MAKYKVGDMFLMEITDMSDSGMGTVYYLNNLVGVSEDMLIKTNSEYEMSPVKENATENKPKTAHTPEELKLKIFALSKLLAETIEVYQNVTRNIEIESQKIDSYLEDCKL